MKSSKALNPKYYGLRKGSCRCVYSSLPNLIKLPDPVSASQPKWKHLATTSGMQLVLWNLSDYKLLLWTDLSSYKLLLCIRNSTFSFFVKMEKDLCKTIVKRISTGYAHDRMQKAQQLLERFRLCDCMAYGGKRCACVRRPREVLNGKNNTRDKETQTEERTGKC